jgi:dihydrofolate reductase
VVFEQRAYRFAQDFTDADFHQDDSWIVSSRGEISVLKISIYIATSLDGFIARLDGGLDWLEGADGVDGSGEGSSGSIENEAGAEDYGFAEIMGSIDTMVMGRATYEFVAGTGLWVYEGKRVVVLSTTLSDDDVSSHLIGKVEFLSMEPRELIAKLAAEGTKHIYVDGGVTIQRFLRAKLVTGLILTQVPVLLGSGIPLFGELDHDVRLKHRRSQVFANGFVQSRYTVDQSSYDVVP